MDPSDLEIDSIIFEEIGNGRFRVFVDMTPKNPGPEPISYNWTMVAVARREQGPTCARVIIRGVS
jgi:hypothetical protein